MSPSSLTTTLGGAQSSSRRLCSSPIGCAGRAAAPRIGAASAATGWLPSGKRGSTRVARTAEVAR
jgi:hypothetical protein